MYTAMYLPKDTFLGINTTFICFPNERSLLLPLQVEGSLAVAAGGLGLTVTEDIRGDIRKQKMTEVDLR